MFYCGNWFIPTRVSTTLQAVQSRRVIVADGGRLSRFTDHNTALPARSDVLTYFKEINRRTEFDVSEFPGLHETTVDLHRRACRTHTQVVSGPTVCWCIEACGCLPMKLVMMGSCCAHRNGKFRGS